MNFSALTKVWLGPLVLFLTALGSHSPLAAQPEFPELSGRVVDEAEIIPADLEAELTAKLEALEEQSQRQLVIATVPSLQDYEIGDYGYQLGRAWGIGDEERNDGIILLVAPNERRVRIEVGYGLEPYVTDALSSIIIRDDILPRFRNDDYPGGIAAGTDRLITQLQLSPEDAARVLEEAAEEQANEGGGIPIGTIIWLGFVFFFFVLPILRAARKGRRYRGKGRGPWGKRSGKRGDDEDDDDDDDGWGRSARDIILWEVGSAIVRGAMSGGSNSGGSWGGGGGGFGGGFSGGGGSFGGGGASGGW